MDSKEYKRSVKQIVFILLTSMYFVSNWLIDIYQNWVLSGDSCAENCFSMLCGDELVKAYYSLWYFNIALFMIMSFVVIVQQEKIKKLEDELKC